MSATPISVLLKQFVSFTSARRESPGSTKVMSTHCKHGQKIVFPVHILSRKHLGKKKETYRIKRSTMHGQLNQLNRRVHAGLDGQVGGQRHLGQAHGARVGVLAGAEDLERRDHGETHVERTAVGGVAADAEVDVHERGGVALEPARLEGDGAAFC